MTETKQQEATFVNRVPGRTGSFRPDYLFAPSRFAPESESILPT